VYLARVSIPVAQLERVKGFVPTPGMPAEILIQTHERTFFEYLTKPISDSMARAFREY
jgi:HlyD family secretion protein